MMEHLIFCLYGPIASWGGIAVGEERPSYSYPTKSAVIGMVEAALGIRGEEEEKHRQLYDALGYAVDVYSFGNPLRDFNTVMTPQTQKNVKFFTRKDELILNKDKVKTITSHRDYITDACYKVCLWEKGESPYPLRDIKEALIEPEFVLYLGRKACPPALFFNPSLVETDTLLEALNRVDLSDFEILSPIEREKKRHIYWDEHPSPGMKVTEQIVKRDKIANRRLWQFFSRTEHYTVI